MIRLSKKFIIELVSFLKAFLLELLLLCVLFNKFDEEVFDFLYFIKDQFLGF